MRSSELGQFGLDRFRFSCKLLKVVILLPIRLDSRTRLIKRGGINHWWCKKILDAYHNQRERMMASRTKTDKSPPFVGEMPCVPTFRSIGGVWLSMSLCAADSRVRA
jgi:hypothetical protein